MWGGGDSWGMPGMMTGQQDLVNKVKTWQRQSTGHRKAWELYCQVNGTTKFDPSAKEVTFLQAFLEAAEAGQIPVEQESSFERSEKQPLVEAVKRWQRQGQGHKEAWWKFCGQHGSADYDPNRHEIAFLQTFLSDCESGVIQPEAVSADGMGCGCGKGGKGKGKGKGLPYFHRIEVGVEDDPHFRVVQRLIGPKGKHMQDIVNESPGAKVWIIGRGSRSWEDDVGPLMICVGAPTSSVFDSAVSLAEDLLAQVREEHRKFR
mmetsp:Transcript_63369/g.112550  ORF Transcript_63369/g.112550 Transcript_63369/m.112550 type:complete len:261 (-) Transcript_63369:300-1082(-)